MTRPAREYVHGPGVVVPDRVAAVLWRYALADFARVARQRNLNPDVDAFLSALQMAGDCWLDAAASGSRRATGFGSVGTGVVGSSEPVAGSGLTTSQAAHHLRVTPRAVVKAIAEHRLDATRVGRDWRISPDALAVFAGARRAAS